MAKIKKTINHSAIFSPPVTDSSSPIVSCASATKDPSPSTELSAESSTYSSLTSGLTSES